MHYSSNEGVLKIVFINGNSTCISTTSTYVGQVILVIIVRISLDDSFLFFFSFLFLFFLLSALASFRVARWEKKATARSLVKLGSAF